MHYDDAEFRVLEVEAYDWRCSAPRRFENVVDFAHFAWLHEGLLGSRDRPEVPRHEVRREGGEIRVEIEFEEPSDTQKNANLGLSDEKITAEKRYRLFMPFCRSTSSASRTARSTSCSGRSRRSDRS